MKTRDANLCFGVSEEKGQRITDFIVALVEEKDRNKEDVYMSELIEKSIYAFSDNIETSLYIAFYIGFAGEDIIDRTRHRIRMGNSDTPDTGSPFVDKLIKIIKDGGVPIDVNVINLDDEEK